MHPCRSRLLGGRARVLYHADGSPEPQEGVMAMAEKPDSEEIVAATVEVDGRR